MCMSELKAIHDIHRRFCSGPKPFARILTIYIEESSDGQGALNSVKPVKNHHRNIEERVAAANRMIRETGWTAGEVICDSMKNEALERYEAFPERLLIIQDGIVVHEGGKGPIVMVRYDPRGQCYFSFVHFPYLFYL